MSIGKVTTWVMTEQQRLDYIKKHPIVPTKKPTGSNFSNVSEMQYKKSVEARGKKNMTKVMDVVDKDQLHKLFMSGKPIGAIAKDFNINENTMNNYIQEQRRMDPEKWPYRAKGR
jgi:hypothetical protein